MWTCKQCGAKLQDQFTACWKCASPRQAEATLDPAPPGPEPKPIRWRLQYEVFRGTLSSWDDLFTRASDFASVLGPERVLTISHSCDHSDGVVTVWYWVPEQ